jgi:hypothetical protein
MLDKKTQVRRGGARPGSGRRKQWTHEKLLHLLFDFEAQRRSTRVKLSDSQLCVRLTEKLYRGLSAATIRRKLQEARISRKLQDACIGAPTSILDLINTAFTSLEPSMSLPVERISNSRADFKLLSRIQIFKLLSRIQIDERISNARLP